MPVLLVKVLKIIGKIIFWAIVVYLVLGFIILPFVLTWAIRTQGVKYTNHNVHVKSVRLNPLSLSLSINGLEVLGEDKKVMAGFQRFFVNVSALSLFKKVYRVEDVTLDGLQVNAALLPDGSINLLKLVPENTQPAKSETPEPSAAQTPESQPQTEKQSMPNVVVDRILLTKGNVTFTDLSVTPNFHTALNDINVTVTGFSTDPASLVKVVLSTMLDAQGKITSEAQVRPWVEPLDLETTFNLDQYAMTVLTPYVGKYTGRELSQGKMDLKMTYRISDNKLVASHKLLIQKFEFGKGVESKDALNLPFGLAVALLEDPQGRITIALPVKGDLSDPEFEFWPLVGQVARNFFIKLVTKPFGVLASVVGGGDSGTDETGEVRFIPGKAELSTEDKAKLLAITEGLKQRPKLSLAINGSYDPQVDWKAIKTEVFEKDFAHLKKESTKLESWVYRELYQRRFGVRALFRLINEYQRKKEDIADNPALNAEIKRQLIEDAPPDKLALDVLAQTRAKIVYDLMLASGFDANRLSIGANKPTQSSMGLVPLEFTLTVYGETPKPAEEPPIAAPAP